MSDLILDAIASFIGGAFGAYAMTAWRLRGLDAAPVAAIAPAAGRSRMVYQTSGDVIQATPITTGGRTVITRDGAALPALCAFRLYQGADVVSYTISRELVWRFVNRKPPLTRAGFTGANEAYSQLFRVAKLGGWIEQDGKAWRWVDKWHTLGRRVERLYHDYGIRVV